MGVAEAEERNLQTVFSTAADAEEVVSEKGVAHEVVATMPQNSQFHGEERINHGDGSTELHRMFPTGKPHLRNEKGGNRNRPRDDYGHE